MSEKERHFGKRREGKTTPRLHWPVQDAAPRTARPDHTIVGITDITGLADYKLVLLSNNYGPGAGMSAHTHPGDKLIRIEVGELTVTTREEGKVVFRVGEVARIRAGVMHSVLNLTDHISRSLEILIVEQNAPMVVLAHSAEVEL